MRILQADLREWRGSSKYSWYCRGFMIWALKNVHIYQMVSWTNKIHKGTEIWLFHISMKSEQNPALMHERVCPVQAEQVMSVSWHLTVESRNIFKQRGKPTKLSSRLTWTSQTSLILPGRTQWKLYRPCGKKTLSGQPVYEISLLKGIFIEGLKQSIRWSFWKHLSKKLA